MIHKLKYKINISKTIYFTILLMFIFGCLYFYNISKAPNFNILIGTPLGEGRINYANPIKNKDVVNYIQLGLIQAKSIENPEISKNLPDAVIRVDDTKQGVTYLFINVWIDKEKVIFGLNKDQTSYKETIGDWGNTFIEYIKKYG